MGCEPRQDLGAEIMEFRNIELARIEPDPLQPRRDFDIESLADLGRSIQAHGVLQPIIVRKNDESELYIIIAGERRYRAAEMIGLLDIPCVIASNLSDESTRAAVQLVENIARVGLSNQEISASIFRMLTEFNLERKEIARLLGKSPPYVTRMLMLQDKSLAEYLPMCGESPNVLSEINGLQDEDKAILKAFYESDLALAGETFTTESVRKIKKGMTLTPLSQLDIRSTISKTHDEIKSSVRMVAPPAVQTPHASPALQALAPTHVSPAPRVSGFVQASLLESESTQDPVLYKLDPNDEDFLVDSMRKYDAKKIAEQGLTTRGEDYDFDQLMTSGAFASRSLLNLRVSLNADNAHQIFELLQNARVSLNINLNEGHARDLLGQLGGPRHIETALLQDELTKFLTQIGSRKLNAMQ